MPVQPTYPGVYIEEVPSGIRTIMGVSTSITAFVGYSREGPLNEPIPVLSVEDYERAFGGLCRECSLGYAVSHFFAHGGQQAVVVNVGLPPAASSEPSIEVSRIVGESKNSTGIHALQDIDLFNILCLPEVTDLALEEQISVLKEAISFCVSNRAFLIVDAPKTWVRPREAIQGIPSISYIRSENAAMYYPRVIMSDPLDGGHPRSFPASGMIAGIYARIDSTRGVWKPPAGVHATLSDASELVYTMNGNENARLNPLAVNCLRSFPATGIAIWGSRTLIGTDESVTDWRYISVRRLALFIEESLYRGTRWVVFEPNDEPLWAQIRLNVGAFMHILFRQGAFQGTSPRDAYFVKCDRETTTQSDINQGIVNLLVGFAPLKPSEFVMIKISQIADTSKTEEGTATQFSVNPKRFTSYKNFKFRVKWDGRYVAGISKVGALKRTTEVVEHREGGDPSSARKSPGQSKCEAITLESGITYDAEFEQWSNKAWEHGVSLDSDGSPKDLRKDIVIDVFSEAGEKAISYKVYGCWPSEFQALPVLDASANAIAIQTLTLQNEGWERVYED